MRRVRTELTYLNMLIRELITGSAAGFTVLAISVALMTVFMHYDDVRFLLKQIDSQTIGQHVLNVPAQAIAAPLGVSTVEGEGGFLIAEDLSEAVPPAPSVPASSVPVTVPIDSDPNSPAVSPAKTLTTRLTRKTRAAKADTTRPVKPLSPFSALRGKLFS